MGSPLQNAGLTPQHSVVNADGTPTMFFFRWLAAMRSAMLTAADLAILESFTEGALDATVADTAAIAGAALMLAGASGAAPHSIDPRIDELEALRAFGGNGCAADPAGDRYALEALIAQPAPLDPLWIPGRDIYANIPTGLNQGDTGRLFYATDRQLSYRWNGFAWAIIVNNEPILADTYGNWTSARYDPANYAWGQQFLVTTRNTTYTIVLGVWTYSSGVYIAPIASLPTTGFNGAPLSTADTGLMFYASDTGLLQYWTGTAWAPWGGVTQTVTNPTGTLQFSGVSTGISGTPTCTCIQIGRLVVVSLSFVLSSKGSALGAATLALSGIPVPAVAGNGIASRVLNMAGLTSTVSAYILGGGSTVYLAHTGPTGTTPLTDANFTNTSIFNNLVISYVST
jgi:hypothetical protein